MHAMSLNFAFAQQKNNSNAQGFLWRTTYDRCWL